MNYSSIFSDFIYLVPAVLIAIILHEWAHGFVSYLLGDPNPKLDGRLSLNPLKHLDPIGTICLVLFHFGWAKPVQVNPNAYKNPKMGMVLTALAGPIMNFIVSFICLIFMALVLKFGNFYNSLYSYLFEVLRYTAILSVGLGVFNLIPVPPLDGSKVLFAILPSDVYFSYMRYERYGMFFLMLLLITGSLSAGLANLNSDIINGMWNFVLNIMF